MSPPKLSIVSPVFRAAPIVEELVRQVVAGSTLVTADFEIVLVDDGSPDNSWAAIVAAAAKDQRVRGIRLSRNFGQHRDISAGLANSRGEHVVVMDCDLQDDPAYIPALVEKARQGFDVVLARRAKWKHSWIRNLTAGIFFRVFNTLTDRQAADSGIGGYSLINRKVVESYLRIGDVHRHYLLILGWMGFKTAAIPVEHRQRLAGRSSYSFGKLISHALEGITSQSTKLLRISVGLGFAYFIAAIVGVIYLLVSYYLHGFRAGWASTFVLLLGSTGLILMAVGILGIYIGNIFDQVRARPLYLIQESCNFDAPPR